MRRLICKLNISCLVLSLFIFIILLTVACNRQQSTAVESENSVEHLAKNATFTFKSIKPELKKLMTYMQLNPQVLTPDLLQKAAEKHVTISELGLSDKFPGEFPLENGNTFEVYIELFDGSVGSGNTVEDAAVYFTLDVDRYAEDAGFKKEDDSYNFLAHVAATSFNKVKGLFSDEHSVKQLTFPSASKKVDYLWFLVGGEERLSAENEEKYHQEMLASTPGLAKAQKSSTTVYIWLTKLKLKTDKDAGSNEEFELYYHGYYNSGVGYAFPASTNFLFDGHSHTDFSGYTRYFSDVNDQNNTYLMLHPIAIATSSNYKIAAIEDDTSAGAHKNSEWNHQGKHRQYMSGREINTVAGNTIINNVMYYFWIHDDVSNDDDVYGSSLISEDGYNSVGTTEWQVDTPDVTYWLRSGTVAQADGW